MQAPPVKASISAQDIPAFTGDAYPGDYRAVMLHGVILKTAIKIYWRNKVHVYFVVCRKHLHSRCKQRKVNKHGGVGGAGAYGKNFHWYIPTHKYYRYAVCLTPVYTCTCTCGTVLTRVSHHVKTSNCITYSFAVASFYRGQLTTWASTVVPTFTWL